MSTKPFNVAADNPTTALTQITSEVKVTFDKNLFFISGIAGGNACGKIISLVGISFFFYQFIYFIRKKSNYVSYT